MIMQFPGSVSGSKGVPVSIPSLTHPEQTLYPYDFGLRFH